MADKPVFDAFQIENAIETNWGDGNQGIKRQWPTNVLTYQLGLGPAPFTDGANGEGAGYTPMQVDQAALAVDAFKVWGEIANITFSQQVYSDPTDADITMAYSSTTKNGGSYTLPSLALLDQSELTHAAIWLSTSVPWLMSGTISQTGYGFDAMVHEIGHTLGLSHPGPYNFDDATPPTYADDAEFAQDTRQYTIMSYFGVDAPSGGGWNVDPNYSGVGVLPSTPMLYDIMAIQDMYGANTSTRSDDTIYGFNSNTGWDFYTFKDNGNPAPVLAIWDGGGNDTIDASFTTNVYTQRIDLRAGAYSDIGDLLGNVVIAFNVTIENAIGGAGADTITGNDVDNHLVGNAGNDKISGQAGNDRLEGGAGLDVLHGGLGNDTITGGNDDDFLYGDAGADNLDGGAGGDFLDGSSSLDGGGGGGIVPDVLTGGPGDDVFVYGTHYRATVVTDFTQADGNNDTLNLTSTPAHSFLQLLSYGSQQGADTVFNFGGGDVLTLKNFSLDSLDPGGLTFSKTPGAPSDFVLVPLDTTRPSGVGARVAALANGGFIVVEEKWNADRSLLDVPPQLIANTFDARAVNTGTFVVNTTPLVSLGVAGQDGLADFGIRVATLTDGRIVVAWDRYSSISNPGLDHEIEARILDPNGVPLGPDFQVNELPPQTPPDGYPYPPFFRLSTLAATPGGGFIIDWDSQQFPPPPSPSEVWVYRRGYDATGQAVSDELIATVAEYPDMDERDGQFLTLSSGAVLHTWQNYDFAGDGHWHAYAQIVGATNPIQLDRTGFSASPYSGYVNNLRAAQLEDGRIALTWAQLNGTAIFSDTESAILNADLHGSTRPGTAADNTLEGSQYDDRLYGLDGNDTLIGDDGADILDGGPGNDTADYRNSLAGVFVDLGKSAPQTGGEASGDTLASIENLTGSSLGDHLVGDGGANTLRGGYGKDSLEGKAGNDVISGDRGDDTAVYSGAISGYSIVPTPAGLVITDLRPSSPDGIDTLNGVEHLQFSDGIVDVVGFLAVSLNYAGATGGVYVDLAAQFAQHAPAGLGWSGGPASVTPVSTDHLAGIRNVTGSGFDDLLVGDVVSGFLSGLGGNDLVYGNTSQATADNASQLLLGGGAGNNALYGSSGFNTFIGGDANGGLNQVWGGASKMAGVAGFANNTLSFAGVAAGMSVHVDLEGGHNAHLNTGAKNDGTYMLEDAIRDVPNLIGSSGGDILVAGHDTERLQGGGGADSFYAGIGTVTFAYAAPSDSSLFSGYDTIVGFKIGTDKIDVSALHTDASHLLVATSGADNSIYVEATPGSFNASTDLAVNVVTLGSSGLHASDFIF